MVIKQFSCSLTRTTVFILIDPAHDSVDDVLSAPCTVKYTGLVNKANVDPPTGFTLAEMANDVVAAAGAVTTNVNVAPPSLLTTTDTPLPLGPYVVPKSLSSPVVAATSLRTVIVHVISSPMFTSELMLDVP